MRRQGFKISKTCDGPLRVATSVESVWLVTYNDPALYPHFDVVIEPDDDLGPLNINN